MGSIKEFHHLANLLVGEVTDHVIGQEEGVAIEIVDVSPKSVLNAKLMAAHLLRTYFPPSIFRSRKVVWLSGISERAIGECVLMMSCRGVSLGANIPLPKSVDDTENIQGTAAVRFATNSCCQAGWKSAQPHPK